MMLASHGCFPGEHVVQVSAEGDEGGFALLVRWHDNAAPDQDDRHCVRITLVTRNRAGRCARDAVLLTCTHLM